MLRVLHEKFQDDAVRIFVTAWLIYAAFWNPWLQSSMTYNFLDAAVSFVDTGRWEMAHPHFYGGKENGTDQRRGCFAPPPRLASLFVPLFCFCRCTPGPCGTAAHI